MSLTEKSPEGMNKEKDRLWIVTELYYPEETSTGYYMTRIAEGLAGNFDVRVVCGQPNYSARDMTSPKYEYRRKVRIRRVFSTRFDKNVILFRLINMLTLSISIFCKSFIGFRRNDLVLVVTTPPLLPFITGFCAFLKRSKHVLLIHDNYPEILIAAGKTSEDSVLTRILNMLNRILYGPAARIIVVGRDMKKLVSGKLTAEDSGKIEVIPNWAEIETVEPMPRSGNGMLDELGLKDKLVFLYAGNMGYPNDIESILEVAVKLREDDRFHFIFLGAGVKRKLLEECIKAKKVLNITLLDPKPRSQQKEFLNACDVAVVSLVSKMWGVSMPSRTYNILAAGKPILALCEKDSEIDLIVREEGVGWSIDPGDPDKLLQTIEEIHENQGEFPEMSARARRHALQKYNTSDAIHAYKELLEGIASDNE